MSHYKIGFHTGPGGNRNGIGDYWRELDNAGIPATLKSVDDYGPCFELASIARASGVAHSITFRLSNGQPGDYNFDVPNYSLTPDAAAEVHWAKTLERLPPEFDKELVWLELINEVDKNLADWLGYFAKHISEKAIAEGYKVALFGWSAGEPEPEHWKLPGMRSFLEFAGAHQNRVAVSLHEYSFERNHLMVDAPHFLVGRFVQLLQVCDEMGIARPRILITEFGWTYQSVPGSAVAMPQLHEAADLYALYSSVESAAIWYLGSGFGDIHNQTQRLIAPLTAAALAYEPPEGVEPPLPPKPPNTHTFTQRIWNDSLERQMIELMPEAALQKKIYSHGFIPVSNEYRFQDEGISYAVQIAEKLNVNHRRVYYAEVGDWGNVKYTGESIQELPILPPDPDPEPILPPPPASAIDLLQYFIPVDDGMGPLYELKDPDGAQRRVQTQVDQDWRKFWITKGTAGLEGKSEWEELAWDAQYIWRGIDTSPGHNRFYTQREAGLGMARWCKRFMKVGETFHGLGHHVQFYIKTTCEKSSENSGNAANQTTLFKGPHTVTFNGLTISDVVELGRIGGESFWFAKGLGMIGWKSGWNESYISEIHEPGQRQNNEKEPVCNF